MLDYSMLFDKSIISQSHILNSYLYLIYLSTNKSPQKCYK